MRCQEIDASVTTLIVETLPAVNQSTAGSQNNSCIAFSPGLLKFTSRESRSRLAQHSVSMRSSIAAPRAPRAPAR